MTTEFRIDKPGTYQDRNGFPVHLWPLLNEHGQQWVEIASLNAGVAFFSNGCYQHNRNKHEFDIVAYLSPLPEDILQGMRNAMKQAEEA
jgi:hypothetical protein